MGYYGLSGGYHYGFGVHRGCRVFSGLTVEGFASRRLIKYTSYLECVVWHTCKGTFLRTCVMLRDVWIRVVYRFCS